MATKTTYATFLLYSLFNSGVLGAEALNTKALIFNVKGEDLLFLDHPNRRLRPSTPATATTRSACRSGRSRRSPSTPRPGGATPTPGPTSPPGRPGVDTFFWTLGRVLREELLPFLFADAEDDRQQYTMVVHNVAGLLKRDGSAHGDDGAWQVDGEVLRTYHELVDLVVDRLEERARWTPAGHGHGHRQRLHPPAAVVAAGARPPRSGPTCRSDHAHTIRTSDAQVTVVDLHNLHDRAKRFVVGVTVQRTFEAKEASGVARPLLFLVLDELNKYAPREGQSPIKEILLDVAERGAVARHHPGRRPADGQRGRAPGHRQLRDPGGRPARRRRGGPAEYGFLPAIQRQRATIVKPGTMFVSQPEIPVPLVVEFPFPAWATRPDERAAPVRISADPFEGLHEGAGVKLLHTSDWHVGKVLKGVARLDEHGPCSASSSTLARREAVDLVVVAGDLYESAAPPPEAQALVWSTLLDLRATGAELVVIAGNHDNAAHFEALRPLAAAAGITVLGRVRRPDDGGVIRCTTRGGERVQVAALPFLSQRYVVRAAELMAGHGAEHAGTYADRCRLLLDGLCAGFSADTVNVVVAHAMVAGRPARRRGARRPDDRGLLRRPAPPSRSAPTTSPSGTSTAPSSSPAPPPSGTRARRSRSTSARAATPSTPSSSRPPPGPRPRCGRCRSTTSADCGRWRAPWPSCGPWPARWATTSCGWW